jgi:uncharacterized protein
MTLDVALTLFVAGVAGGLVSAIAGGSNLVTFPALMWSGLPPLIANASNIVASTPGNFLAALIDRNKLPPIDGSFFCLMIVSWTGTLLGALVLTRISSEAFQFVVPILVGVATLLFVYANRIRDWITMRLMGSVGGRFTALHISLLCIFPVSVYGGFFGAGVGMLLLAVLSIRTGGDYRAANTLKNLVGSLNNLAPLAVFQIEGVVAWPQTFAMMAGVVVGGLGGGRISRLLSPGLAKPVIVLIGIGLSLSYAAKYWF